MTIAPTLIEKENVVDLLFPNSSYRKTKADMKTYSKVKKIYGA